MKKLSTILFTILTFAAFAQSVSAETSTVTFTDVPKEHVNYVAINYLANQGVVKGSGDGTFKPDEIINRAAALKLILVGNKTTIIENLTSVSFSDIKTTDWFSPYIETAKKLGIVGGNPDGTFAPGRNVTRADYLKMLLAVNGFKTESWADKKVFNDVPADAWFAPYVNYAGQAGLIVADSQNNVYPAKELTRGEAAEIYYLLTVIRNGSDTQFLLDQAEAEMSQIEIFIAASNPLAAKHASELAVDMTQQAYQNMPTNSTVLGAAKLAKAYDFLVNAYISALQKNTAEATSWANQAITKATEAWEANNSLQTICRHIKDRANEILTQLGATATGQ
jgi:hypothetical protein